MVVKYVQQVSKCILATQDKYVRETWATDRQLLEVDVKGYALEFDTAKQRFAHERGGTDAFVLDGEYNGKHPIGQTVLVQRGTLLAQQGKTLTSSPFLVRSLVLDSHSSQVLLTAIKMRLPFDISSVAAMRRASFMARWFWFFFCCDRDSGNATSLRQLIQMIVLSSILYPHVLSHVELCNLHGFQLARNRGTLGKAVSVACCSWSRLTRQRSISQGVRVSIVNHVNIHANVKAGRKPEDQVAFAQDLVEAIYGPKDADHFWTRKKGKLVESSFLCNLNAFLNLSLIHI